MDIKGRIFYQGALRFNKDSLTILYRVSRRGCNWFDRDWRREFGSSRSTIIFRVILGSLLKDGCLVCWCWCWCVESWSVGMQGPNVSKAWTGIPRMRKINKTFKKSQFLWRSRIWWQAELCSFNGSRFSKLMTSNSKIKSNAKNLIILTIMMICKMLSWNNGR